MVADQIALGTAFDHLLDDTEESLLGTPLHQLVIVTLFDSLTRHSRRNALPWVVGNQLRIRIPRGPGRPPYQPSPDILVHATLGTPPEASLDLRVVGPPALAIEIASPSTAREHDLNTLDARAKPAAYAAAGIPEYLAYDPTGEIIPEVVRAWRADERGRYQPWLPDARGHWVSRLGISFAPVGVLLRVYDAAGQPVPSGGDLDDLLAEREHRIAAQNELIVREREIAALQAELRRLRGE